MKRKRFLSLTAFLLILTQLYGCTVAGFIIGSAVNSRIPDSTAVQISSLKDLEYGTRISVKLKNGNYRNGYFIGITNPTDSSSQIDSSKIKLGIAGTSGKDYYSLSNLISLFDLTNQKKSVAKYVLIGLGLDIFVFYLITNTKMPNVSLGNGSF